MNREVMQKYTYVIFEDEVLVTMLIPLSGRGIIDEFYREEILKSLNDWRKVRDIFRQHSNIDLLAFQHIDQAVEVILAQDEVDRLDFVIADWRDKRLCKDHRIAGSGLERFEYIVSPKSSYVMGFWVVLAAKAFFPDAMPIMMTAFPEDLKNVYDGKKLLNLIGRIIGEPLLILEYSEQTKEAIWDEECLINAEQKKAERIIRNKIQLSSVTQFCAQFAGIKDAESFQRIRDYPFPEKNTWEEDGEIIQPYWTLRTLFPFIIGNMEKADFIEGESTFGECKRRILSAIHSSSIKNKMLHELFRKNETINKKLFHRGDRFLLEKEDWIINEFEEIFRQKKNEYEIDDSDTIVTRTEAFIRECRERLADESSQMPNKVPNEMIREYYYEDFRVNFQKIFEQLLDRSVKFQELKGKETELFARFKSDEGIFHYRRKEFLGSHDDIKTALELLLHEIIKVAFGTYEIEGLSRKTGDESEGHTILQFTYTGKETVSLEDIVTGTGGLKRVLDLLNGYCDVNINIGEYEKCLYDAVDPKELGIKGNRFMLSLIFTLEA